MAFFFTIKSGYSGSLINGQSKLLDSYNGLPMPRITRYLSKAKNQSVEKNKPTGKKKKKRKRRSNNLNGFPFLETSAKTVYPELSKPNCPNQILFFFLKVYNHLFNDVIPASPLPSSESKSIYKKGKKETENRAKRREKRRSFCVHA